MMEESGCWLCPGFVLRRPGRFLNVHDSVPFIILSFRVEPKDRIRGGHNDGRKLFLRKGRVTEDCVRPAATPRLSGLLLELRPVPVPSGRARLSGARHPAPPFPTAAAPSHRPHCPKPHRHCAATRVASCAALAYPQSG